MVERMICTWDIFSYKIDHTWPCGFDFEETILSSSQFFCQRDNDSGRYNTRDRGQETLLSWEILPRMDARSVRGPIINYKHFGTFSINSTKKNCQMTGCICLIIHSDTFFWNLNKKNIDFVVYVIPLPLRESLCNTSRIYLLG